MGQSKLATTPSDANMIWKQMYREGFNGNKKKVVNFLTLVSPKHLYISEWGGYFLDTDKYEVS